MDIREVGKNWQEMGAPEPPLDPPHEREGCHCVGFDGIQNDNCPDCGGTGYPIETIKFFPSPRAAPDTNPGAALPKEICPGCDRVLREGPESVSHGLCQRCYEEALGKG